MRSIGERAYANVRPPINLGAMLHSGSCKLSNNETRKIQIFATLVTEVDEN
jgi:hypothetical protein